MATNWLKKYQTGGYYEVKKGDSLWDLSQSLGVSFDKLLAANPQLEDPSLIYEGQKINIPGANQASVAKSAPTVKKITVKSEQKAPTMTFNTMPIGTMNRGTVSDNTSVQIRTAQGAPVTTGYGQDVFRDPTVEKNMRNIKALKRMKQNTEENVDFVRDNEGNVVTDAQGNPTYNPAKGTTYGDSGMLPFAILTAPLTIPAAIEGAGALAALPLFAGAPAWATVGNALTAATIPSIAKNISEGDFTDALLLATPYAAEKTILPAATKMASVLDETFNGLKNSKDFISLAKSSPGKAAEYIYKNHRGLYNSLFDGVYDLKKFKENPMGFLFGKKLNPLTPELIQLAENTPKIPEAVQNALHTSRDLHKLTIDAEFFKKEKDVERQLQSLKGIHDKMPVLSEEDFFRVTGVSKEAVVKQINRLEKQLGLEPSKLTYADDPAKIVDLTAYESELTFKKSKNPLDDIQPIYPVGYTPSVEDYIIESTYQGSRNAKSMGVQYGRRYEGEELSPTIIYDPAKPETDPRRVLIEGKRKFQSLGSGKRYINATSLSTDSKQMELRSIVNQLKQGNIKNVETEGLAYINDMGSTSKLPRRALVDEMNQYIDEMNVYLPTNKKVPHAVLQKNGDIWAPHFTLTKKREGGYINDEDVWLDKYEDAGTVTNTNTVSLPSQTGGQSFINYTNTENNPVSLTGAKFSCPGGTCNLPTGEIAPGQTVQIPVSYTSTHPGSLYLFNSAGAMQNYKMDPQTQIENFKAVTTPAPTQQQANSKPTIEATKKAAQSTGRMGEMEKHTTGFYDGSGKNWYLVNGKLVPAPRFKYGGNAWLDKYK
jgi:spore coat assembly protein SafA